MMLVEEQQIHELLTNRELQEAWDWLLNYVQLRPTNPGVVCYFDNKCWNDDPASPNYQEEYARTYTMLSRLYIASQFGDQRCLIEMANGACAQPIFWVAGYLDRDIRAVIDSVPRFRNHLSEHLSYWIRLAIEKKQRGANYRPNQSEFAYSKPNIQPEDKGPDGLYVEVAPAYKVEVQSVKNSIGNPRNLIASSKFRASGKPTPKKLLDDFWLLRYNSDGLLRLEELLDRVLTPLQPDATQQFRLGLIKTSYCNAVVVGDTQYANEDLFHGYEHVTPEIRTRIATYLGAVNWRALAAETNRSVIQILHINGFL
jgi:hypothetical protein